MIAEVRLDVPSDMVRHQLAEAPSPRGRMLAAPALGRLDDPSSIKALLTALAREEEFWGVRAEAAGALGNLRDEEVFQGLSAHASTAHPKVRRAVVRALGHFRTAKAVEVLKPIALRDASYLVEAEAARALGSTKQSSAFDTLLDLLDRPSWGDVIRTGAIDGLANLRDERAVPHVVARTRYGVPSRGRRAAIMALPKLASDRKARETLEDLLESPDPHLRADVVRALGDLGDTKARSALHRQLDRDLDGRVRRRIRETLRDLGGSGRRDAERHRDELEALRAEHSELKVRVGKLEALLKLTNGEKASDRKAPAGKTDKGARRKK